MLLERMRQCRLNFAEHRYDCEAGIVGEHNATELIITPPAIMPDEAVYRLCFEPGGVSEIIPKMSDGTLAYPLPAAVTATAFCCMTLIGYIGNEQVYKSRMVQLHFCRAADGDADIDPQQPGIIAEVNRNTAARHTHANKAVLDKFAESKDGKPTYDGEALGSGGSTGTEFLVVNVQIQSQPGAGYTVTSHDKTYAQIDEAYKAGKQVLAVCTDRTDQYLLPLTVRFEDSYEFILFDGNSGLIMDSNKQDSWTIDFLNVDASAVGFSSTLETFPSDINKVSSALDWLIQKAHEHSNKSVLDGLSDSNGVLRYNGNLITTQKISEGSVITLSDNTEYRLTDVTTLTLTYPTSDFECWMRLTFAESGNITVTLPADTKYIGTAPDFKNGETWELSFKDKVLAAQKVGEGT